MIFTDYYTFAAALSVWTWILICTSTYRYLRLIIMTVAHWLSKSTPLPKTAKLTSRDVTVIIPTIENDMEELRGPIQSILACNPFELMLVTTTDRFEKLKKFVITLNDPRITVDKEDVANKRRQLCVAIPKVKTDITVLVDDDVTWPVTILPWLLAPFETSKREAKGKKGVGAVGTCQKVRRPAPGASLSERCWNWLSCVYIERRNFEISASHFLDGGTSCMSGRTCALRSEILKDGNFSKGFCEERWGNFQLNADDDNFVTRWLVNHGWDTKIQYNDACMIETTLENNPKFLAQCLRWSRSNWRSNYTTLFVEKTVWSRQSWSIYTVYGPTFSPPALIMDAFIFFAYHMASKAWNEAFCKLGWTILLAVFVFSKNVKLIGLYRRNMWDLAYAPVEFMFGYVHSFIKIYALYTWNVTSWGSRPDGDIHDSERMSRVAVPAEVMKNPAANTRGLIRYTDEKGTEMEQDNLTEKVKGLEKLVEDQVEVAASL